MSMQGSPSPALLGLIAMATCCMLLFIPYHPSLSLQGRIFTEHDRSGGAVQVRIDPAAIDDLQCLPKSAEIAIVDDMGRKRIISGKLVDVSADAIIDAAGRHAPYYTGLIMVDKTDPGQEANPPHPSMPVDATITLDETRIVDTLLDYIRSHFYSQGCCEVCGDSIPILPRSQTSAR